MLGTKGFLPHGDRPLVERLGLNILALSVVKPRQVVEAGGYVGVTRTQDFLANRQRPLVERLGLGILPLTAVEQPQVIEAGGQAGVVGAQGLLVNRQRPPVERLGLRVLALDAIQLTQVVEAGGNVRVLGTENSLPDCERPLVERLSLRKARPVIQVTACLVKQSARLFELEPIDLNERRASEGLRNHALAPSPVWEFRARKGSVHRPHGALRPLALLFLRQNILNHFLHQPVDAQRLRIGIAAE
jgi:hypothetical protein